MPSTRRPTSTSNFGVSRRENHDARDFYARFAAPEVSDDATIEPEKALDEIVCGDARAMGRVPDRSVALVVTSPPYFAGKEYEQAMGEGHVPATYLDYLQMLEDVFAECVRTLEPGGRLAVNVANLGRRPFRSLSADVTAILQDRLRLLLRGEIVWVKGRGANGSCAWGSFQRPGNPVLRDVSERVVVASKGRFDRAVPAAQRARTGLPSVSTLSRDEFMEATTDVWELPAASATRVGHPAPFPVELPERLIHLNTYLGDLVLDPFMGSGTTAVAAVRTGRHFVGYDTDPEYVAAARRRVDAARDEPGRELLGGVRLAASTRTTAGPRAVSDGPDTAFTGALRRGLAAKDLVEILAAECGFTDVAHDVHVAPGLDVTLGAQDAAGRRWWFDLVGGVTVGRGGLRRADLLWRAIGRAAVAAELEPDVRYVVVSAGLPVHNSPGDRALRAVCGPDRPVRAVVDLLDPASRAALARLAIDG
jgi:site-specific DNA-methyltransferase (adenine-specific)